MASPDLRTRLSFGFAAAVAFIVLVCAVAVIALHTLRATQDEIIGEHLPTVTAAFRLAQKGEGTARSAPLIVASVSQPQRHLIYHRVRDELARLDEELTQVPGSDAVTRRLVDDIANRHRALDAALERLNEAVARRVDLLAARTALSAEARDLRGRLWRALDGLAPDTGPPAHGRLARSSNRALHLLMAAASAHEARAREDFAAAFAPLLAEARSESVATGGDVPPAAHAELTATLDRMAELGTGERGLFAIAAAETAERDRVDVQAASYYQKAEHLSLAISRLTIHAITAAARASDASHALVHVETVLLTGLAGLCVLGALVVVHLSRGIAARLFDLHRAMVTGAAGLPVRIDTGGTDEIARMAQSLEIFVASREQAEALLRDAKERAEDADLAKTKFLAAASHDLRQPMQALGLFVAALDQCQLDAQGRMIVGKIEATIDALGDLLDSLLDISRLEAGAVVPHIGPVAIGGLIGRLAIEFEPVASAKGLRLHAVACGLWTASDPALLARMVRNLIANAIRYTDRGGVLIGCRRQGDTLRIEVWDTGLGIAPEQIDKVFRAFHQVPGTPRDGGGLGLGLAIVRRGGRLLDHHVGVRSVVGRGSVFSVAVPLADAPAASASTLPAEVVPDPDLAGRSVVVVDDDRPIREGLGLLLHGWGMKVVAAESLDEAIMGLSEREMVPDVIVTDFRLPGGDNGGRVVAYLRTLLEEDIPGIVVTGDTGLATKPLAGQGVVAVLRKPVRPEELRATLARCLLAPPAEAG